MILQDQYDEAMFAFSTGDFDGAISRLKQILEADPVHFDAQLSLGMAYCRKGDYAAAIAEGHKAEQLCPKAQLVHTNLSLFYLKAGDKTKAEHHGVQARIASWREEQGTRAADSQELPMAKPQTPTPPESFPEMPWKKQADPTKPPH